MAYRFETSFLEELRQRCSLETWIGKYTALKQKGSQLMGLCPFPDHQEKSPSFSVSSEKQLYHCFGCGKSGNVYSFLRDYNGMSFPEAVEILAQSVGMDVPREDQKKYSEIIQKKLFIKKINHEAQDAFLKQRLQENSKLAAFFKRRNIQNESLEVFAVGYAPDAWDFLSAKMKSQNLGLKKMESTGLFKSKDGKSYYDVFRDRIIFPIRSTNSDVIGFGGRSLDGDTMPKYLNSPETVLFQKKRTLYGLYENAKYIRAEDQALIVEGYMDVLMLHQFGFKNAVGVLGTAFTEEHAKKLKSYTGRVCVIFDGDNAGRRASEKALKEALKQDLMLKAVYLPESQDPDSFLNEFGAQKLRDEIESSKDLFSLILESKIKSLKQLEASDKINIVSEMKIFLDSINDRSILSLYFKELAERLDVTSTWLKSYFKSGAKVKPMESQLESSKEAETWPNKIIIPSTVSRLELTLLNLILKSKSCLECFLKVSDVELWETKELEQVSQLIKDMYRQNPNTFASLSSGVLEKVQPSHFLTKHLADPMLSMTDEEDLHLYEDCIKKIAHKRKKEKTKALLQELKIKKDPNSLEKYRDMLDLKIKDLD